MSTNIIMTNINNVGCRDCDYISSVKEDGAIFCKLYRAKGHTDGCMDTRNGPYIFKNGEKIKQALMEFEE